MPSVFYCLIFDLAPSALSWLYRSQVYTGCTRSASNLLLAKLPKSRPTAHLHSFVPLFSCLWNQLSQSVQSHSSLLSMEVMFSPLSVCLFVVCLSIDSISKCCGWIRASFVGEVGCVTRKKLFDFLLDLELDPDLDLDAQVFSVILHC